MEEKHSPKDPNEVGKQVVKTAVGVAVGTMIGKLIAGLVRVITGTKGGGC